MSQGSAVAARAGAALNARKARAAVSTNAVASPTHRLGRVIENMYQLPWSGGRGARGARQTARAAGWATRGYVYSRPYSADFRGFLGSEVADCTQFARKSRVCYGVFRGVDPRLARCPRPDAAAVLLRRSGSRSGRCPRRDRRVPIPGRRRNDLLGQWAEIKAAGAASTFNMPAE